VSVNIKNIQQDVKDIKENIQTKKIEKESVNTTNYKVNEENLTLIDKQDEEDSNVFQ